ncbi:hypothetical protein ACE60T_003201 [Salmonella enterica]
MSYKERLIIAADEVALFDRITACFRTIFQPAELWLKETTPIRKSGEPVLPPRRHVVTGADRALLEIMPDGSLRPVSAFSFRRFPGDKKDATIRYPEGPGTVRSQPFPEARALTQTVKPGLSAGTLSGSPALGTVSDADAPCGLAQSLARSEASSEQTHGLWFRSTKINTVTRKIFWLLFSVVPKCPDCAVTRR